MSIPVNNSAVGDGDAAFHRTASPDRSHVDFRLRIPLRVASVVDAEASNLARRLDRPVERSKMVERILIEWAAQKHRDATVLLNVAGSNPMPTEWDDL